jgi:hypothetical protein
MVKASMQVTMQRGLSSSKQSLQHDKLVRNEFGFHFDHDTQRQTAFRVSVGPTYGFLINVSGSEGGSCRSNQEDDTVIARQWAIAISASALLRHVDIRQIWCEACIRSTRRMVCSLAQHEKSTMTIFHVGNH